MRDSGRAPRLLIVSNRLPVTVAVHDGALAVKPSAGGLATGLRCLDKTREMLWLGWSGAADEVIGENAAELARDLSGAGYVPIPLSASEVTTFYEEISNSVLWPLCHDRIDQLPLHVRGWDVYESVNERYADTIARHWRPGDEIWIHDYQLLRLPLLVRRRTPEATIGFFLHIPFPNPEIFFTLPVRQWLIEGVLGADLIGFHTRRYRGHFTAVLRRLFGIALDATTDDFAHDGRRCRLGVFPMSIDAAAYAERAASREVSALALEFRQSAARTIVGIDRLDYSKGIQRRLLAFEEMLRRHPEWRERIRLIQVAVPSRGRVGAYRHFRTEVEALVSRINGEYATPTWTPIQYLHRSVDATTLAALYRVADIMLVTPVRDGMNLVAKEFVASRSDEDGVLILSEFAGAAAELTDALIVNPYDVDGVASAIHDALVMSGPERRTRMRKLRSQVFDHDVHRWANDFLTALGKSCPPMRVPV